MPKKRYFCYCCENEFSIIAKTSDPIEYCPFCGGDMEEADTDEEEED